jgi:hypothetical protein
MVYGILEFGMRWDRSEMDPTVDVILDLRIHLTEGEVHLLLVAQ